MTENRESKLSVFARIAEATLAGRGHYRRLYGFGIVSTILAIAFGFIARQESDPQMVTLAVAWIFLALLWVVRGAYAELIEKRFRRE